MLGDQRRGEFARDLLRLRAARRSSFSNELFAEHGWTMLLHLFAAQTANEVLGVEQLVARLEVAASVGRRWLSHLEAGGQVVIGAEGKDVTLSTTTAEKMRSFIDEAMTIFPSL